MNDSFKCRGKRIDNNNWAVGYLFVHERPFTCFKSLDDHKDVCYIQQSCFADWDMPRPVYQMEVFSETVGRCTGILAFKSYRGTKNEELLMFEGDLVLCEDKQKRYIHYSDGMWCISRQDTHIGSVPEEYVLGELSDDFEIVGTIHDEECRNE